VFFSYEDRTYIGKMKADLAAKGIYPERATTS